MDDALRIEPVSPTSDAASLLIGELTAELSGLYEHALDGKGDFDPTGLPARSVFLVGSLDALPVACGAVRPLGDDIGEVKRMYVRPAYRGRGFSKQVLASLEQAALSLGYQTLRLETGDRQTAAVELYSRCGYHRIPGFGEYRTCLHSVCFEKSLVAAES